MSFFKDLNNKLNESLNEGKKDEVKECDKKDIPEGKDEENESKEHDDLKDKDNEFDELDEGFEAITESMSFYICNECASICESEGVCPECNEGILEEAVKVVVRDGKVLKKKVGKKKKQTAKQKAALAKARKKAHTGAAQKARAKSLKVRKSRVHEGEEFECPECGYVGAMNSIEPDVWECPDCGAELELDESVNENVSESIQAKVDEYLELLEVPQEVMHEGYLACINYLAEEFGIIVE